MPAFNESRWAPHILGLLRIVASFLFMAHGSQKLFGFPGQPGSGPLPTLMFVAGILELFGGALVLAGFFTRQVAFILSGEMAVAYFMSHAPQGFWPLLNKGELAALYSFLFLYLSFAGSGSWSLDKLLERRH